MHQALIRASGERMGAFSRDRRFRRHPGVTNGVRAGHAIKLETGRNFVGAPDLLENLHAPAATYNLDALGVPDRGDNSPLANRRHSDNQVRVVSLMSGYGGNSVLLLPNRATFYIFSDGDEWEWFGAVNEINKIAPFCH